MKYLNTNPMGTSDHDDIYELLMVMHKDLSDEESIKANAKLILTLINHIGDIRVVEEAVKLVTTNSLYAARNNI